MKRVLPWLLTPVWGLLFLLWFASFALFSGLTWLVMPEDWRRR